MSPNELSLVPYYAPPPGAAADGNGSASPDLMTFEADDLMTFDDDFAKAGNAGSSGGGGFRSAPGSGPTTHSTNMPPASSFSADASRQRQQQQQQQQPMVTTSRSYEEDYLDPFLDNVNKAPYNPNQQHQHYQQPTHIPLSPSSLTSSSSMNHAVGGASDGGFDSYPYQQEFEYQRPPMPDYPPPREPSRNASFHSQPTLTVIDVPREQQAPQMAPRVVEQREPSSSSSARSDEDQAENEMIARIIASQQRALESAKKGRHSSHSSTVMVVSPNSNSRGYSNYGINEEHRSMTVYQGDNDYGSYNDQNYNNQQLVVPDFDNPNAYNMAVVHPLKRQMKKQRKVKTATGVVGGALVGGLALGPVGAVFGGAAGGYATNKLAKAGERRAQRKFEQRNFQATALEKSNRLGMDGSAYT